MTPAATLPPTLCRLPDWPMRLEALVHERWHQPFAWGVQDCALFAADCVLAITGVDVAPPALRQHRSARQAQRLLLAHGGLLGIAQAALGPATPPALATVGDVLLLSSNNVSTMHPGQPMLAVCNGATALAPGVNGLVSLGLHRVTHAWRVG